MTGLALTVFGAEAQFSLSGQFRPRTEMRNGFKKPIQNGEEIALFTEQRTRLTADYKSAAIETRLSFQDIRIWGEVGQINKSDQLLSVHEAYAIYSADSLGKHKIKFGRQELVYDDHRVLGSLGWAAQARSHDALRYMYQSGGTQFHAIGIWNQNNNKTEPQKLQNAHQGTFGNNYNIQAGPNGTTLFNLPQPKTALYLWFNTKIAGGKKGNISFLSMSEGYQRDSVTVIPLHTFGTTPTLIFGDIKLHSSFYYQMGSITNNVKINGMLAHLEFTYTKPKIKPTIGFDYLSGDDKTTANIEGFNPLHGTHHKFYGFMDYFYVGNGHNGGGNGASGGLMDAYFKTAFPIKKSKLVTHLHGFMSPTDVTSNTGQQEGSFLGAELDLVWVKKMKEGVMLKVGYSQFLNNEATSAIKGQDFANALGNQSWAWVMIDITPKFLK